MDAWGPGGLAASFVVFEISDGTKGFDSLLTPPLADDLKLSAH